MKKSSSLRNNFFAVPTPNKNGITNMNFNLINLMISSRARKLVNSLFCMNFSKNTKNIDQIVENFKQIFIVEKFMYIYINFISIIIHKKFKFTQTSM